MADDGQVKFLAKIDGSNDIQRDLNKIKQNLQNLGKEAKKIDFGKMLSSAVPLNNALQLFNRIKDGIKSTIAYINELSAAYETQRSAEIRLETAAKNNPYLDSTSVKRLEDYASSLQGLAAVGDEQLIPFMSHLANSGRTEEQIMKIMSASLDLAAEGTVSLDEAVRALNLSYSGQIGRLGMTVPALKNLTAEELKNGKAIDFVAKQYEGNAKRLADELKGHEKLKNAIGDVKEEIGASIQQTLNPWYTSLARLVSETATALKKHRELQKALKGLEDGNVTAGQYDALIEANSYYLEEYNKKIEQQNKFLHKGKIDQETYTRNLENLNKQYEEYIRNNVKWTSLRDNAKKAEEDANQAAIAEEERIKKEQEAIALQESQINQRDTLRAQYDETIRQKQAEIAARRANGEEISEEAEAQEMYNTAFAAYVKMMSDPAFIGNSGNYEHEVNARADIASWGKTAVAGTGKSELTEKIKDFEAELQNASEDAQCIVKNQYDAVLEMLDAEYKAIVDNKYLEENEKLRIEQEFDEKRKAIISARNAESLKDALDAIDVTDKRNEVERIRDQRQALAALYEEKMADENILQEQKLKLQEEYNVKYNELLQKETDAVERAIKERVDKEESARDEIISNLDAVAEKQETYWDRYIDKNQQIADMRKAINDSEVLSEQEKLDAMEQLDEAYIKNRRQLFSDIATEMKGYTDDAVSLMKDASDLMIQTVQNQSAAEIAALEEKYQDGEISEEEYNKKVTKIKKDAAQQQYRIELWQWGASILQATANIAQGVTKAIAEGGIAGLITGALVGAAGAVQVASIIASKPTPPSFSTGGIVGGSSLHGDNIAANLNSREMVMNMGQQKALWDFINSGSNGGGGTNIVINNSASNIVTAKPRLSKDKIEIMIDARVNESLKKGRYGKSLAVAEQEMSGDYWGI
ncbi:MAG: hypothetical protein IJQ86_06385 [Spirochaetia bacterium]|nr:hypothetical protein [Spirochaetia bacterium]